MLPLNTNSHILKIKYLYFIFLLCLGGAVKAQIHQQAGKGNPIIPGYFADPTVKKFDDTYYMYATTDGNGGGYGPSQVWISKDFVNWSLQDMNWPTTRYYWAPDVTKGNDGKYYLYYCQPVEIFGASSTSPVGPWTSLLPAGKPIVPNFLVPNVITLDGQTFRDDDGKFYMYWGTWGIYPDHGCGVGLLNDDMKSFAKLAQIPNTVAKDFFEAPFMFKRNGIYYLTYSSGRCEDGTYRVQYVMSKTGPMGPFVYGKNNPILATNADGSVHGPGHQSVLQEGNSFYMVYHRHNNPNSEGGFHRQLAADQMQFDSEGNILKIEPSHDGIGFLGKNVNPYPNLAFGAKVKASSYYDKDFKPEFAVDDNNGTLWKPKDNVSPSWLQIDLGSLKQVKSIHTSFEYATWSYQYIIQTSVDGKTWITYADRTKNKLHGSPMVDYGQIKTRYIKITINGTAYPGLNKAIWNIKVYDNDFYKPAGITVDKPNQEEIVKAKGLLVDLTANDLAIGSGVQQWENKGLMQGFFSPSPGKIPVVKLISGKKAIVFSGHTVMKSNFIAPHSLKGNASFTVATWVFNPTVEDEEPIISWTRRGGIDLSNAGLAYGSNKKWGAATHWGWADMAYKQVPAAGKWYHIALVFDGTMEKLFVDGVLEREERKMLFVSNLKEILLGTTTDGNAYFSGAMASIKLYDIPLTTDEIKKMASANSDATIAYSFEANNLPLASLSSWGNDGYLAAALKGEAKLSSIKGIAAVLIKQGNDLLTEVKASEQLKPFTFIGQFYINGQATVQMPSGLADANNLSLKLKGTEQWKQVAITFDGKKHLVYFDGVVVPNAQLSFKKNTVNTFGVIAHTGDIGLTHLEMHDQLFTVPTLKAILAKWKLQHPSQQSLASFKVKPLAISPSIIMMTANELKLPGEVTYYAFIDQNGIMKSTWMEKPVFYDFALKADQQYKYSVIAKDNFGNMSLPSNAEIVNTTKAQFDIYHGNSTKEQNLLTGLSETIWDGLMGKAEEVNLTNGLLKLASTNTNWDGAPEKGPFLFKNIIGNFIVETELADISGLAEKKAKGANDAGLMVLSTKEDRSLLQNSVMLGWGIGNMVTNMGKGGRLQTNNSTGLAFFKHLQIERNGNLFYLRASADGLTWKDVPGSPVLREDLNGEAVKVGLFQATYGKQDGFGLFKDFHIYQRK